MLPDAKSLSFSMISRILNEQRSHTLSRATQRQAKLRQNLPKLPSTKSSKVKSFRSKATTTFTKPSITQTEDLQ
jgi:hypothetical protein